MSVRAERGGAGTGGSGTGGALDPCKDGTPDANDLVVDLADSRQTMDGFGASDVWRGAISGADADLFFDQNLGIGLSILRVGITPTGGNHADWSNITKAAARAAIVWATPFSPPANCKSNNSLTDGGHLNPSCDEQNGSGTQRLYTMGNYSKFVRPGHERVGVSGTPPSGVQVSAYRNPADGTVVIVAINSNTSPTAVFVSNGAPCEVPPWVTSASNDLATQSPVSISAARFTTTLAGQSVTTFVGTP